MVSFLEELPVELIKDMVLSGDFTFQELTDAINKWECIDVPGALWIKEMAELIELERRQKPAETRKPSVFSADNVDAAPEQTGRIDRVPDRRSDLYSLGIVLYELFAGEHPFQTADPIEMLHAHIVRSPVPLCDKSSVLPGSFRTSWGS